MKSRLMHLLNGDSVRWTMERSQVPGNFVVWADVLHEGFVPTDVGSAHWRESRARFIADSGLESYAEALRTYESWDAQLASYRDFDEVVLWLEHDLFDQLLLVRHLDWFSRREPDHGRTKLSLICVGEFPGVVPFHGLGQLSADQLASLLDTRLAVTERQLWLGREVWVAFTATDPGALQNIASRLEDGAGELPFLGGALRRLLEEYPSLEQGLPRTERHILECLHDGPLTPVDLFRAEQHREERVFMGDWTFWSRLRELSAEPNPLIALDAGELTGQRPPGGSVRITNTGREVLAGNADWVRLHGLDRWLGGVHLEAPAGGDVRYRWDPGAKRLRET